jgi:hypothetical protein
MPSKARWARPSRQPSPAPHPHRVGPARSGRSGRLAGDPAGPCSPSPRHLMRRVRPREAAPVPSLPEPRPPECGTVILTHKCTLARPRLRKLRQTLHCALPPTPGTLPAHGAQPGAGARPMPLPTRGPGCLGGGRHVGPFAGVHPGRRPLRAGLVPWPRETWQPSVDQAKPERAGGVSLEYHDAGGAPPWLQGERGPCRRHA